MSLVQSGVFFKNKRCAIIIKQSKQTIHIKVLRRHQNMLDQIGYTAKNKTDH